MARARDLVQVERQSVANAPVRAGAERWRRRAGMIGLKGGFLRQPGKGIRLFTLTTRPPGWNLLGRTGDSNQSTYLPTFLPCRQSLLSVLFNYSNDTTTERHELTIVAPYLRSPSSIPAMFGSSGSGNKPPPQVSLESSLLRHSPAGK